MWFGRAGTELVACDDILQSKEPPNRAAVQIHLIILAQTSGLTSLRFLLGAIYSPHAGADMSSAPRRYRICNPVKHLDIRYGYGMSFVGRPHRAAPAGYPHHHLRCPSDPVIFGSIRICTRTAELPVFSTRGSAALHPWLPIFCRYAAKPHASCPLPLFIGESEAPAGADL